MTSRRSLVGSRDPKRRLVFDLITEDRWLNGESIEACLDKPTEIPEGVSFKEEKFTAEYFGEKALEVKQKFHSRIKELLDRLLVKYDYLSPHLVIVSCDYPGGTVHPPNLVGVDTGNFLAGQNETLDAGLVTVTHELGHYKLLSLYDDVLNTPREFSDLYFNSRNLKRNPKFIYTFSDDNFVNNSGAGHPHDNAGELYASAFMIAEMGFLPKYKELFFPTLNDEQKQLAERIFEFVQRVK